MFFGAFLFFASDDNKKAQALNTEEVSNTVVVATIDGEIRSGTVQFISRSIEEAKKQNADLFIILLETPGGLLGATEEISRLLLDSPIKTAVFVNNSGGWAFSAGTFILLSAEIAVSHPYASIGAAQPKSLGLGGVEESNKKIVEASSIWIESIANARDRNSEVAVKFVRENLTMSGIEAYDKNIIDLTSTSLDDLLKKLDMENAIVKEIEPNILERILFFISLSYLVPLLLGAGTLGLFFVFRTGEIEVGIFAAAALLLGLWGMGAINLSLMGTMFLLLGIMLIVLELFIAPEFGVFGVAGTLFLLFGIITFADEPFLPSMFDQPTFWIVVGSTIGICLFFIIVGRLSVKTLNMKAKTGSEALVGEIAVVIEDLNPYGRVKARREYWTAKSNAEEKVIKAGEKATIVRVEGNVILVEAIEN